MSDKKTKAPEGTPEVDQEIHDSKVDVNSLDIEDMDIEDIMKLDAKDFFVDEDKKEVNVDDTDDQSSQDNGSDAGESEKEDSSESEDDSKEVQDEEPEELTEEQKIQKRIDDNNKALKESQGNYTRSQQKLKEIERKIEEKELRLKLVNQEDLTEEQLLDLKEDDPDAYIKYHQDKFNNDQINKKIEQSKATSVDQMQLTEVEQFAKEIGIDTDDDNAVNEFFKGDKFAELGNFVENNLKKNSSGVYSAKDLVNAYKLLNIDEYIEKAASGVRESTIEGIQKAAKGGSSLDRVSRETPSHKTSKMSIDKMSQQDIDELSPDEVNELMNEFDY